jgi:N-acetylneuraminic acid mutarotase/thiol-disulfide isomerase/thioredoxin
MKHMLHFMAFCALLCLIGFQAQSQIAMPGGSVIAAPGLWTAKTDMPAEKVNHGAAVLNGNVYIFGGSGTMGVSLDTYIYNIATDTWTTAPASAALQIGRISPMVEAVNGKIYIIGGYSQLAPLRISSTVLEFDPASSLLATKATMPLPVAGAGSFVSNNKIFILGGCGTGGWNADMKDTIQIYDPAANTWTVSPSKLPVLMRTFATAKLGDQVVIAGGYSKNATPIIKSTWSGQISGDEITWTKVDDYPAGEINRMSAGASATKMYFSSGQLSAGSATTGKTYILHPDTKTWEAVDDNPTPAHSACPLMYDGSGAMLLIGGRNATSPSMKNVAGFMTEKKPNMVVSTQQIDVKLNLNRSKELTMGISNTGAALLTWNATIDPSSATWLKLSATSGDLQPDAAASPTVNLSSKGLGAGTYTATIKITSNDAQHATKDIPVTFILQSDPIRDKKVLLEEFTGTWCPWCPYGVDKIHELEARFGDKMAVASHHYNDAMMILDPKTIVFYLKGSYFPGATIDRTKFAVEADTIVDREAWTFRVNDILTATPLAPVGISFAQKQYNPANKQMNGKIAVKFYEDVNKATKITIMQTESGLNYKQNKANWTPPVLDPFFHENVVRQIIPDHFGDVLTSAPTTSGSTVEYEYSFTSVDSVWANSQIVVIVAEDAGASIGPVLQTYSEGLIEGVEGISPVEPSIAPTEYALLQNYPNPVASGITHISYNLPKSSSVRLAVFDMLGRQVATLADGIEQSGFHTVQWNAQGLNAGVYLCKFEADGVTLTRSITVVK